MRHTIYDRTKADVEISTPGGNLCTYQKVRRISSAPSCYLGSAESPTADFLQVWLKSSRSGPRRWCCLSSCRPQVIWRLSPLCFYGRRLSRTVPACCTGTTCQNLRGCQNLCARLGFHYFLWKIQNSFSASKCPITAPKIRTWWQLLSKFSYNIHKLLDGGRPRFGRSCQTLLQSCCGECVGGGGGPEMRREQAASVITSGWEGRGWPCNCLHSTYL